MTTEDLFNAQMITFISDILLYRCKVTHRVACDGGDDDGEERQKWVEKFSHTWDHE